MRLNTPPGNSTKIRPTSDRSREALFSILSDTIDRAHVLDLYAGTGALGLEALSRGARSAIFVDNDRLALAIIAANIKKIEKCFDSEKSRPSTSLIKSDLRKGLDSVITVCRGENHLFDVVFLDPPYDKGFAQFTLEQLAKSTIITDNCIIVAEERSNKVLSEKIHGLRLREKRRYGDTCFWMYSALDRFDP